MEKMPTKQLESIEQAQAQGGFQKIYDLITEMMRSSRDDRIAEQLRTNHHLNTLRDNVQGFLFGTMYPDKDCLRPYYNSLRMILEPYEGHFVSNRFGSFIFSNVFEESFEDFWKSLESTPEINEFFSEIVYPYAAKLVRRNELNLCKVVLHHRQGVARQVGNVIELHPQLTEEAGRKNLHLILIDEESIEYGHEKVGLRLVSEFTLSRFRGIIKDD